MRLLLALKITVLQDTKLAILSPIDMGSFAGGVKKACDTKFTRYIVVPLKNYMISGRLAILIAEDSEDNRFLLEAYCKGTSYDLTFAEDGEKAVEAYKEGAFQIVVMDVQMPVMDGLAATRQIRTLETSCGAKRTPILALTANVMPTDVELAHQAGCDIHLSKPISKKLFLSALEQWKPNAGAEAVSMRIDAGKKDVALAYLMERKAELALMRNALESFELNELLEMATSLKSPTIGYEFPDIPRLADAIVQLCLAKELAAVSHQIGALALCLEKADGQVREMC